MCGANKLTGKMELVLLSEFHCLVMLLFSATFSCFLLDSFELQDIVCLTKHGGVLSAQVMMKMLAIR